MTREDAYYMQVKLLCGHVELYDPWLNTYLEEEDPLSDIVLKLLDCQDNLNDILRCLNLYCLEMTFDAKSVYRRLRLELCKYYENATMTKDRIMSELFRISQQIPDCPFQNQCLILSDYYYLLTELEAMDMSVNMGEFDAELYKWLTTGGTIDTHGMPECK